jgi:hypothetical protein
MEFSRRAFLGAPAGVPAGGAGDAAPAERVAFVPHDMFDLSFDGIAPIGLQAEPERLAQLGVVILAG